MIAIQHQSKFVQREVGRDATSHFPCCHRYREEVCPFDHRALAGRWTSFMSDTGISLTTAACNKKLKAFLTAKGTHFIFEASKRVGALLCSSVFVGIVADS